MLEQMVIAESNYEGVVEPSYKNPLGKTPTVLVTAGKREDNPTRDILTQRWVGDMVSTENNMWISHRVNGKPVLSTAPGILLMNSRSREILVLSTLMVSLLRTAGIILYQGKKLTGSRKIIP